MLYAVRVKPQHPIGTRHRAEMSFSRDYTYLEEVPEAVLEDEWLEVREATEDEVERFGPRDEAAENPQTAPGGSLAGYEELAMWVIKSSVKEIMEHVEEAQALGNLEAAPLILAIEQARGEESRKTLIAQLEEIVTAPSGDEGSDEDQQDS